MQEKNVIAIFAGDIHLSLNPPIWRSSEPDWFEAMLRPLVELGTLQILYNCPVVYAGDIFDKWNSSPELINFAIEHLPKGLSIAGQHDLPLHNYEDIQKSAYWTLYKEGTIRHITEKTICFYEDDERIILYPFSYRQPIKDLKNPYRNSIHVAVAHEYKWIPGASYTNAPIDNKLHIKTTKNIRNRWKGYDVVVYGDNHLGWQHKLQNCSTQFFNCGSFMRRASDEIDYQPQVGLLTVDGQILSHRLDCSKDKYIKTIPIKKETTLDLSGFIDGLKELGETALDFKKSVDRFFKKYETTKEIQEIILKAMEK